MSVLITGGSGFIGSALAYKLKALGHTVFIYSHQNLDTLNKTLTDTVVEEGYQVTKID